MRFNDKVRSVLAAGLSLLLLGLSTSRGAGRVAIQAA
jgi:hypothetical protein